MKHNIVLIGFMGCGKTTIGKELAKSLNFQFIDTDTQIEENAKKTINEIFATQGEEYFRELETSTISDMVNTTEKAIISTGGGLPLRETNSKILKKLGFVVYLRVQRETVEKRLEGDTTRPLLQGDNVSGKIEQLLAYRDPIYEIGAHMVLDVDGKSVEEITEEIHRNFDIMSSREKEKNRN